MIPKEYIKKYKIDNLWKYNLPNAWRLLYTIKGNEVMIVSVILEGCRIKNMKEDSDISYSAKGQGQEKPSRKARKKWKGKSLSLMT